MEENKKLLKIKEISSIYGLSRKSIDKAINSGRLKAHQINEKERRCKESDVDRWINTMVVGVWG
ncbi:MAG: helix-turn-helix domain-containing protein [Clostridia bacterium]